MEDKYEQFLQCYTHRFDAPKAQQIRKNLCEIINKHGLGNAGPIFPAWHPLRIFTFHDRTLLRGNAYSDNFVGLDTEHAYYFSGGFFAAPYDCAFEQVQRAVLRANTLIEAKRYRGMEFRCEKIDVAYDTKANPYVIWLEDTLTTSRPGCTKDGFLSNDLALFFIENYLSHRSKDFLFELREMPGLIKNFEEVSGWQYLSEFARMYIFNRFYSLLFADP